MDDHGGRPLERVDLESGVGRQHEGVHLRVAGGGLRDLGQQRLSFGVIVGPPAREDEAAVDVLLGEAVRPDRPHRVLVPGVGRDLDDDRLVAGDPETIEHLGDLGPRQLAVLLAHRIDGRVHDQRGDGEPLRELRQREDRRIVPLEIAAQQVPHPPVGAGQIVVAPPHPVAAPGAVAHERQRRHVVGHDQVRLERQRRRVRGHPLGVRADGRVGHRRFDAGEAPFQPAHRRVEVGSSDDDLPAGVDPEILQHRDDAVQELRRSAAEPARVDVHEPPSPQPLGEPEQELQGPAGGDVAVGLQARGDHRPPPSVIASSQSWSRRARVRSRLPPYGFSARTRAASDLSPRPCSSHAAKSFWPRPRRTRVSTT